MSAAPYLQHLQPEVTESWWLPLAMQSMMSLR